MDFGCTFDLVYLAGGQIMSSTSLMITGSSIQHFFRHMASLQKTAEQSSVRTHHLKEAETNWKRLFAGSDDAWHLGALWPSPVASSWSMNLAVLQCPSSSDDLRESSTDSKERSIDFR